jgi:hypothetical protein
MIAAEDNPLEAIRQEHEGFLSQLEGLAVEAIASNDWTIFYAHVTSFPNDRDCEANTKDLTRPGAGLSKTTVQ